MKELPQVKAALETQIRLLELLCEKHPELKQEHSSIHVDHGLPCPVVTYYEKRDVICLGPDGWVKRRHGNKYDFEKIVDGVKVRLFEAEDAPKENESFPVSPFAFEE